MMGAEQEVERAGAGTETDKCEQMRAMQNKNGDREGEVKLTAKNQLTLWGRVVGLRQKGPKGLRARWGYARAKFQGRRRR